MGRVSSKEIRSTTWYVPCPEVESRLLHESVNPGSDFIYVALHAHISNVEGGLSFQVGDKFVALEKKQHYWKVKDIRTKRIGDVPANSLQELNKLEIYDWYSGKMRRQRAELLLLRMGKPGTFIIRESGQSKDDYSLSIRDKDSIKHYRIFSRPNGGFSLNKNVNFSDLPALVEHYKRTLGGLCTKLKYALDRTALESWEIPRERIKLGKELGKGNFATVFEGKWNITIKVAVKVLNSDRANSHEVEVMKSIKHKNIVTLLAICTQTTNEPMYIVMELVANGALDKYLITERRKLNIRDLLQFAEQAAEGLAYLEQKCIIHRDVAARNLLVGKEGNIKIADFGLSIIANSNEDRKYNITNDEVALRWTAPEAANTNHFTSKSDVWSFGVLLYEIFTKCAHYPYPEMNGKEAFKAVCYGYRMKKPSDCPQTIYDIMLSCWDATPENRPAFEILLWKLREVFPDKAYEAIPEL